jgi:ABC-type lipoprotein export system ATPase subunit
MSDSLTTKYIEIQDVEQTFRTPKGPFPALRDINLTVAKGEFVALIGHSGCGKSTLLNLIAGLTSPTRGTLICANREIAGPGPERAVVFQNHSLLPWLTCYENVYLAVERVFGAAGKSTGVAAETKAQLRARTEAALALVGLTHAAQKRPGEISGGMKQRVGIARALSHGAAGAADGRALWRTGRAHARQAAGRTAGDRGPHQKHRRHGHARCGRGRAALRQDRDDDQRPGRHHRRGADGRSAASRASAWSWPKTRAISTAARP